METYSRQSLPKCTIISTLKYKTRDGAAALVGSLGVVPSINTGDEFVMGEP